MIKKWTVVSTWGKQGSGDGEFYLPQGLDAYQDKILVADSGNARLQLWNTNGQFLKNITLSGDSAFNFPVGVNFNDQIIVTDQRKNRVVYLKKDFTLDQFSSPTEPFRLPTGLDYSSASQTLALVDSDNSAIRLIKGDLTTATLDKFSLVSPLDVKWNNNNLVISDWGNKKIVLGTTTGEITKSLNLDYTPGMLSVDPKGNIYVPDTFGGRLQVFDSNLKLSNTVILSNIAYPGAVVFHDGRLYLTARDSHKIIVLEEQY
jgi:sugar lactone lactonase YvrE